MSNQIKRPYPDNWPWGAPHKHPEGDTPPPFEGFNVEVPEEGTVMSNLAHSVREAKMALNSVVSVPAVFACDVEDGDIVIPLPCEDNCNINCDELLKTLRDLGQIPDAIWIPAFRTSTDTQISTLSAVDPTTYDPPFYGVAYTKLKRVMVGPVVVHPRFKFHTGDKIYAGSDGDLTTTANEHMVGVCLAPGAVFLSQYASVLRESMKDLYDEATRDAEDNTIEKIEQEGLQGDNIKVTTDGATTERPLELHLGDIVNVKDFGAKGDGVTNDTNAFNAAIAHMQELGSNVCLFIPPGDYLVTTLPNVPCYGPGSVKYNNYLYSPFELLFKLNGAIQKDTNGRYKVDFTKMSEADLAALIKQLLPATGGGLTTDDDGKLVVDFTQMSEDELREMIESLLPDTGGGLTTDEDGKLVLDFSQLTPTQKEDLISQIVQEGGGLSVDEEGKIYVDFDSMPTDKFEAMLKSIKVPIWLTNIKNFYVNTATGSDTIVAGIGESSSKPFKTIQACVDYVSENYNVSDNVAIINIAAGTYTESLQCGDFSRTTGYILLRPLSGDEGNVIIKANIQDNLDNRTVRCSGGYWIFRDLELVCDIESFASSVYKTASVINGINYATVALQGCRIKWNCQEETNASKIYGRVIWATGNSVISFQASDVVDKSIEFHKGSTPNLLVLTGEGSATIEIRSTNEDVSRVTIDVWGECNAFCSMANRTIFNRVSGAANLGKFNVPSGKAVTGARYNIRGGAACYTQGAGTEFFPGDSAGSVDSTNYSIYS